MTRGEVEQEIDRAFEGEAMPRSETELAEPGIEASSVVEHFFGRSRSDVDASAFLPSLHMEDFTYMTDKAVAYYLPVVLKLMLRQPHFELWIHLSAFLGSARQSYMTSLRGLRRSQHEAIASWADFLVGSLDGSFGCKPKTAAKLARLYRDLAAAAPE